VSARRGCGRLRIYASVWGDIDEANGEVRYCGEGR
jgi:hypothetical protein